PYCLTPAVEALEQRIVPVVLPGLDIANVDVVQGLLLPALTSLRLPEQAQKDVITDVVAAAKNIPMSGPATDTLSMSLFAAVIDLAAADLPMYRKDQAEFAANVGDALLMSDSMMNLTMAQTEFMSLGDMNAKLGGFALSQKDAAVVMQSYSTLTMFVLKNGGITQESTHAFDFVTTEYQV